MPLSNNLLIHLITSAKALSVASALIPELNSKSASVFIASKTATGTIGPAFVFPQIHGLNGC